MVNIIEASMRRFEKVYESYDVYKKKHKAKIISKIAKNSSLNREGYGYIKRRMGLLSNEVKSPTYKESTELSDFIEKNTDTKSSK